MSGVLISFLGNTLASGSAVPQVVSNANPMPVTLSGGIGGLNVQGVQANGSIATAFPVIVGGVDGTGVLRDLLVDATGALIVSGGGGGNIQGVFANGAVGNPNPVVGGLRDAGGNVRSFAGDTSGNQFVVGNAASATADAGNPVKIGGAFNTVQPIVASGQRVDAQFDNRGAQYVSVEQGGVLQMWTSPTGNIANGGAVVSVPAVSAISKIFNTSNNGFVIAGDAQSSTPGLGTGIQLAANVVRNGATFDYEARPRTAFRLPSSAASNNAANIKTSPGVVFNISGLVTLVASTCYLKLFDTTGAPNPAALVPLYMFPLAIVNGMFTFNLPNQGLYFPTGIGIAIVANPADLDNTAIAAGQITGLNVSFQ
jgi:hypothetical protein